MPTKQLPIHPNPIHSDNEPILAKHLHLRLPAHGGTHIRHNLPDGEQPPRGRAGALGARELVGRHWGERGRGGEDVFEEGVACV